MIGSISCDFSVAAPVDETSETVMTYINISVTYMIVKYLIKIICTNVSNDTLKVFI